jgi:hypothetical protein
MLGIAHLSRTLLLTFALGATVVLASGCSGEPEPTDGPYEGTVGDAMIDFIATIDEIAEILADVDSVEDCESAKAPLAERVERLRGIHELVGDFSSETWDRMPSSLGKSRRAATRRFNAEAVRVLLDRPRARVLGEVLLDVPDLISVKSKAAEDGF